MTRMSGDAAAVDAGETGPTTEFTTGETSGSVSREKPVDIEHVPVKNDPRAWSTLRKVRNTRNHLDPVA